MVKGETHESFVEGSGLRNDMTGRGDVKFEDIAQLVDNPTYVSRNYPTGTRMILSRYLSRQILMLQTSKQ